MFLHSFAEGVGIGVAFGGDQSNKLGKFISLSLAIHNVPEGLAVGATLTPRGVGFFSTVALAVLSSIPQPIVAVFVYCFMSAAAPLLPLGFGFAAGAMIYVAICELIPEALELGFPRLHCAAIVGGAATLMLVMQSSLG